jgi:hypothetical protein
MLKSKILKICFLILTILFCFHLIDNSISGASDGKSSGVRNSMVSSDHNYSENWHPEL